MAKRKKKVIAVTWDIIQEKLDELIKTIKLFENKKVRVQWVEEDQKWYFSVVDVIEILTDSADPNNYWKILKFRLKKEGNEFVTKCDRPKLIQT